MNAAIAYAVVAIMAGVALAVVQTLRERRQKRAHRVAVLARLPEAAETRDHDRNQAVGGATAAVYVPASDDLDLAAFAEAGPEILFEQQVRR